MQSLKNIEILAVNDHSNDNSLKIIRELAKNDSRIKIINNDKNRGLLYTRGMGIFHSTGKYLMNLDPDDEFSTSNNLQNLYDIIKKTKVDFISFAYLEKNETKIKCSKFNKVITQPKLFKNIFNSENNYVEDYILWNKIVKKNLLIKAYKLFENKIYSKKWNYGEDTIWSILINKYAKSMICVNETIYLYKTNEDSLMNNKNNSMEINNRIYILEMYKQIFKYKDRKYICAHTLQFMFELNKDKIISIIQINSSLKEKIIKILKPFLKKYYCSDYVIQKIQSFFKLF